MTVKKDKSGRRSVQVEVEVPGTPEQVWEVIATGPGVSAWFAEFEVDERVGGEIKGNMGGGMESFGHVTEWDPPRRLVAEGKSFGPDAPTVATEWIVEGRPNSMCVVRVVHSLFAETDDWDNQLESTVTGWPGFFGVLKLYLQHFRGQPCSIMRVFTPAAGTESEVWAALTSTLGIAGVQVGQSCASTGDAPRLSGVREKSAEDGASRALIRLDQPAPGTALMNAFTMADQAYLAIAFYLYGADGKAVAARDQGVWQAWLAEQFPPPAAS